MIKSLPTYEAALDAVIHHMTNSAHHNMHQLDAERIASMRPDVIVEETWEETVQPIVTPLLALSSPSLNAFPAPVPRPAPPPRIARSRTPSRPSTESKAVAPTPMGMSVVSALASMSRAEQAARSSARVCAAAARTFTDEADAIAAAKRELEEGFRDRH